MIKVEGTTVYFKGNIVDLLTELTLIMNNLMEETPIDVRDLVKCVKMAIMSDEELVETAKRISDLSPESLEEINRYMKEEYPTFIDLDDFLNGR